MFTAVVGINWGDEGKGRMVDLLSRDYPIVARYQGGNNAGHTVINERGKFILNLLPSGIFRRETLNIMGAGMVIDVKHLFNELAKLRASGVEISPANLAISERAVICMPYHKLLDELEEDRLGDAKFGSTRRGIAPSYSDKYMKKALRMGDLLLDEAALREKLGRIVEWKNLVVEKGYLADAISADDMLEWLKKFGYPFREYVRDTSEILDSAESALFEAQLGALRDVDFGIYPYTSSSNTLSAYAPIGAGAPGRKIDKTIGIMKAYSSCVGAGPFACELFGEAGDKLREAGGEYGAATGRPRRVGGFDIPASRFGARVQGANEIALTKLDVLSYLEKIPVCTAYDINGEITERFPIGEKLAAAKPIYEYLDGWRADISACRAFSDLPIAAQNYVRYLERAVGVHVSYISVGAERDAYIKL